MKKVSIVISLVLLTSFVLAACGGNNGAERSPGAQGTPGALGTSGAGTIPNTGTTPTTDLGMVNTPSSMATATTSSGSGTGVSTGTPAANVTTSTPAVSAVDMSQSPDRLSALLDYEVRNSSGIVIGKVNGVLVNRNKIVTEDVMDNSTGKDTGSTISTPAAGTGSTTSTPAVATGSTTNTPAAATGSTTSTPAAGTGSASTPAAGSAMGSVIGGASITYFVVELNTAFGETQGTGTGTTGTGTTGTGTTTSTPAAGATSAVPAATQATTGMTGDANNMLGAGDEVLLPFSAFEPMMVGAVSATGSDKPALVLTVDDQVLATAPVFDRSSIDFMATTWDEQFKSFWSGQGLSIPVTGNTKDMLTGVETVLLDNNFAGIDVVNTNKDGLGQVQDFIIDTQSGMFRYAILATGGFLGLGEKYIAVPMEMVSWVVDNETMTDSTKRDVTDVGKIMINVPEDAFKSAPTIDSLQNLDTSAMNWDMDVTSFWQTYQTK